MDTNLIVYFFDKREKDKHLQAKELMKKIQLNATNWVIAQQNLREFAAVLFEKQKVSGFEVQHYIQVICSMFEVLEEKPIDVTRAIELAEAHNCSYWDSLIVSSAQRYGVNLFYTENVKDFEKIPGIKAVNPLK